MCENLNCSNYVSMNWYLSTDFMLNSDLPREPSLNRLDIYKQINAEIVGESEKGKDAQIGPSVGSSEPDGREELEQKH